MANKQTKEQKLKELRKERNELWAQILDHPAPYQEDFKHLKEKYEQKDREVKRLYQEL